MSLAQLSKSYVTKIQETRDIIYQGLWFAGVSTVTVHKHSGGGSQ